MTYHDLTFWMLASAFGISLVYELWRAIVKAGTSEFDSPKRFVREFIAFYAISFTVTAIALQGETWSAWVVLVATALILVYTIAYYLPTVLPARAPGPFDQIESVAFTGLVSVAGALAALDLAGVTLTAT